MSDYFTELLFGKDETILTVIPHHKTDLILRRNNLERYDDRDDVRTNLIESYDRFIAFGQKHLSDPFYLEGVQRISVLDKIMREIASGAFLDCENPLSESLYPFIGLALCLEPVSSLHGIGNDC